MLSPEIIQEEDLVLLETDTWLAESADRVCTSLFSRFIDGPRSIPILNIIADFNPTTPSEEINFTSNLLGRVFEELSFLYLQQTQKVNATILNSEEVFNLFRLIYPYQHVDTYYGLNSTIEGITFPDILILRRGRHTWQLTNVIECKLGGQEHPREEEQLEVYRDPAYLFGDRSIALGGSSRLGEFLHQVRPDLLPMPLAHRQKGKGYQICYAVNQISSLEYPGAKIMRIPVTIDDLKDFLAVLTADCKRNHVAK